MADYHVKVSVRNGRIVRRMREAGIESLAELARRAEVGYGLLWQLVSLRETPFKANGEWRDIVLAVAGVLSCDPEDLFNEQQATRPLAKSSGEMFMDTEQVAGLVHSGHDATEAKLTVQKLLSSLTPREQYIVQARAEGALLQEIAGEYGLSIDRIRQIEAKGHRKMKGASARLAKGASLQTFINEKAT